ncbi:MAG TPA: outer membrane lipoprotein carrier protein LolA [Saprospiraceae bacterium]|nr:outer membrane lipoprotein carrier protein LolA [Saprospiraceae bacterium]HMP25741.1 outer membrane lipoprotein carrier protein LolA [Saprospiraceae bacterium]
MKNLLLFMLLSGMAFALPAQTKTDYNKAADSDPRAKAILDKVQKKYEGYKSLEAAFALDIELPEQPKESQKGKVARSGDKYRVELAGQSVICDGKSIWLIMSSNKEVQINNMPDADEDTDILSPQSLFNFYQKGKFAYVLVNEYSQGGKAVQEIEFKPLQKNFDYSKIRMTVNKTTSEVLNVKAFGKDGSRFTITISQLVPNKAFTADYFTFDKAKYPGYHVEDLRY